MNNNNQKKKEIQCAAPMSADAAVGENLCTYWYI